MCKSPLSARAKPSAPFLERSNHMEMMGALLVYRVVFVHASFSAVLTQFAIQRLHQARQLPQTWPTHCCSTCRLHRQTGGAR